MTSARFLFNPRVYSRWLAINHAAALARLLILLALLLAFAASWSAPAAASSALAHVATHALLADGPSLPCPGLSLPC